MSIRRNPLVPIIVSLLLLPALIGLGLWQLDRSTEKRLIREQIAQRSIERVDVLPTQLVDADDWRWRTVTAVGRFDSAHELLVDNQVLKGRPGYHVITPLIVDGSAVRVLVNRGWIPWGSDRTIQPQTRVPQGVVHVRGRVVEPASEYLQLRDPEAKDHWPRLWQNLDLARFSELSGAAVQPVVIELAADAEHGYERQWRDHDDGWVERHHGYAMQWFGLALTLVILNIVLWHRSRRSESESET